MKRKYREAMRAAARQTIEPDEDDDEDAAEALGWYDEWVMSAPEPQETNTNQRSNK
jgi:hypothetical protein